MHLEEIFTHRSFRCHCGSGYLGKKGEIWFVRIVPPPFEITDYYVIVTTPYIITGTNAADWSAYFERTVPRFGIDPPLSAYVELMKYGVVHEYWNEYVFQAYSSFRNDAVFLHGIPDKPDSLPHFDPESTLSIDLSKVRTEMERRKMRKRAAKKQKEKGREHAWN